MAEGPVPRKRESDWDWFLTCLRMVPLALVAVPLLYVISALTLGWNVHCSLHHYSDCSDATSATDAIPMLIGIELLVVPLTAFAATRWRIGAGRIELLCAGKAQLILPLLMAATLAGLFCYLIWSWSLPQAAFGPDQFGLTRWLSLVLLAAFVWFWLPLFPRLTATLAGVFAGPALFAAIGYVLFPSFLMQGQLDDIPQYYDGGSRALLLMPIAVVPVLALFPLPFVPGPKFHAFLTGGVFFLTALVGRALVRSWAL